MTSQELISRASERLGIIRPNDMQTATAELDVPLRLLLLAPTGSGKTLAFAIPFLRSLSRKSGIKGVVMAPTRELVLQISECIRVLASPEMKTAAFYGGHNVTTEVNELTGNPDIVIATPGRLLDHIRRGNLSLFDTGTLAIDEYDKALELGFHDEMKAITGRMKNLRTLILTSATGAAEIPEFLDVRGLKTLDFLENGKADAPSITSCLVKSASPDKLDTLIDLLKCLDDERAIVFVNHRDAAERVYTHLKEAGFPAGLYHGGLEQDERERALTLFDNGTNRILVSTDLASRGLDIENVGAVVHYHLPPTAENWTHRNGRTARMGAKGTVYVIESEADKAPSYVTTDKEFSPVHNDSAPRPSDTGTLYFNAGKKEKISRGDIAGFIMQKGGLSRDEVGRIDIRDHCAYVAVPKAKMRTTVEALSPHRIKNKRVRVTQLK